MLVENDVGGLNGERAALRHRIAGVDSEVHDHLLNLAGVGLRAPQGRINPQVEVNALRDQAAQHLVHLGNDGVEVEHLRLQRLFAAERKQLPGQRGGAVSGLRDFQRVITDAFVAVGTTQDQFAVAENGGEDIVEVVRNPAG